MNFFTYDNVRARMLDDIDDYRGAVIYFVTEDGRIFRTYKSSTEPRELEQHINKRGYKSVRISVRGKKGLVETVHRIVAKAFVPNPDNFATVDHIDENKLNNHYTNLQWVSHETNVKQYSEKNARKLYIKLMDKKVKRVKRKLKEYQDEIDKMQRAENILKHEIKSLFSVKEKVEREIDNLILRAKNENKRIASMISGTEYGSIDEMVRATGIPVLVNGQRFPSAGSAAQYIIDNHPDAAKKSSISKAIRQMLSGKRKPWVMYGKFNIEPV